MQPYYKRSHDSWYVNAGVGKTGKPKPIKLGKGITKAQAWEIWSAMQAQAGSEPKQIPVERPQPPAVVSKPGRTLGSLIDVYLNWTANPINREKATHEAYKRALSPLRDHVAAEGKLADLPALEIRPYHLDEIIQAKTNPQAIAAEAKRTGRALKVWSETTCWQLHKTTAAMFNWAVERGYTSANPLGKIKEKPVCGVRKDWIKRDEFERLIAACDDPLLTDLLMVLWETGARPFEIFQAQAKHLDRNNNSLEYAKLNGDKVKAKRGNKTATRSVVLGTGEAFKIVCRLANERPEGFLFVNGVGKPWTANLLSARLRVLKNRTGLGVRGDKRKITLYTLRHSFCTLKILEGVDIVTIKDLMGHTDLAMIAEVYAHIKKEYAHLNAAVDRRAG